MYDRGRISPVKVENNPAAEAWLLTDFFAVAVFQTKIQIIKLRKHDRHDLVFFDKKLRIIGPRR